MPSIGPLELFVILVIAVLVVGPKRLPGLARSVGSGLREFKDTVSRSDPRSALREAEADDDADLDDEHDEEDEDGDDGGAPERRAGAPRASG